MTTFDVATIGAGKNRPLVARATMKDFKRLSWQS